MVEGRRPRKCNTYHPETIQKTKTPKKYYLETIRNHVWTELLWASETALGPQHGELVVQMGPQHGTDCPEPVIPTIRNLSGNYPEYDCKRLSMPVDACRSKKHHSVDACRCLQVPALLAFAVRPFVEARGPVYHPETIRKLCVSFGRCDPDTIWKIHVLLIYYPDYETVCKNA